MLNVKALLPGEFLSRPTPRTDQVARCQPPGLRRAVHVAGVYIGQMLAGEH